MSNISASIATDIKSALADDELELPSLPEVALKIREVAESEFVSAVSLSVEVGKDPALAAQLMRIANSPMFRATRSIDDLSQAISRLGVEYSANMVVGLAMQQMFQATSDLVDNRMREVWKRSTEVAAWSTVIANKYTRLRPDQATLAGLTHCIGALPILGWVEENDHLVRDSMTLDRIIEDLHPTIGMMILQHWNFAEDIVRVPEHYQGLNHQAEAADYIDVVSAANLMRLRDTDHPLMSEQWQASPAFTRLGLDPRDEDTYQEHLADADEIRNALA